MHCRPAQLAAVVAALTVAAAGAAGCRRSPYAGTGTLGDAGADQADDLAPADAPDDLPATDAPSDLPADDAADDLVTADAPADLPGTDLPADVTSGDAPTDAMNGDAPADTSGGDAPADVTGADTPADTPAPDRVASDASDVRPEEQPCGALGFNCAPFVCDVARGMCKTVCLDDDDCVTGRPCTNGRCGPGTPAYCSLNAECATGFCAQNVCCQTACTGRCRSCAVPGSIGTCSLVPNGAPDPQGACPTGKVCDGRTECVPPQCATDTDCGRFHHCTNARCVPCVGTCVTTAECAAGATCIDGNGCWYCGFPDAGAD